MSTSTTPIVEDTDMHITSEGAPDKGKGKLIQDEVMDADEEDDEEDEEEEEEEEEDEEDEEMAEEDSLDEIDSSVIQPRRTRGKRVDYTSAEALAKAGLKPEEVNVDDDDEENTYEAANNSTMQA